MDTEFELMRLRQMHTLAKHIAIHGADRESEAAKMRVKRYEVAIRKLNGRGA